MRQRPGLTDREVTDVVVAPGAPQQGVNQVCRSLEMSQHVMRRRRPDGKTGNFPGPNSEPPGLRPVMVPIFQHLDPLSEDRLKSAIEQWLTSLGWQVTLASGHAHGIDIDALRNGKRWIIEAKGRGSLNPMRVNYFLAVLGELLQRMSDPSALYSVALPDLPQFRGLWSRLPRLAKERTHITALFVDETGDVVEVP